jgi:hypothetical protein
MRARHISAVTIALAIALSASGSANAQPATPAPSPAPAPAPAPAGPTSPDTRHEPSAADMATARNALRDGLAARDANDVPGALARLTTAWDLVQTPVTGFELGKTHLMLGHILQAHELFVKVGRMPAALEESSRSATARTEAARLAEDLEPRIPSLRIRVKVPPGATAVLRIDDEIVAMTGAITPRTVNPGAHQIVARAGDGPEQRVTVELKEGETKDVELAPKWVPPKVPVAGTGPALYVRQANPLVFVGFGAAGAGVVLTTVALAFAADASARTRSRCGDEFCPDTVDQTQVGVGGTARERQAWLLVAAISGITSGAFLTMGVITATRPVKVKLVGSVAPFIGPTGAGLTGRF